MDTMRERVARLIWPLIVDYGADTGGMELKTMHENYVDAIMAIVSEDREKLVEALELATDLFENGLVDFKKYGLTCDKDIAKKYRAALASVGK